MRVLIPEFGFEESLRGGLLPTRSAAARRAIAELVPLMALAGCEGDLLLAGAEPARVSAAAASALLSPQSAGWLPPALPGVLRVESLPELVHRCRAAGSVELLPWGWGHRSREIAGQLQDAGVRLQEHIPTETTVRQVTARSFGWQRELASGTLPAGAAQADSLASLEAAFRQLPPGCDRWVIKAELGSSSRERVVGHGREPDTRAVGWVRRMLARDGCVYLEPWLERTAEWGLQFDVHAGGGAELIGQTGLLCGDDGRYLGSRFQALPEDPVPEAATVERARHAAEQAAAAGYCGPLGIDVLQYRDAGGAAAVRPLMDINPRLTMGRLSLALKHLLQPGEGGSWLHVVRRNRQPSGDVPEQAADQSASQAAGWRIVATSPSATEYGPVERQTFAVLARSAAARELVEQQLLAGGSCGNPGEGSGG